MVKMINLYYVYFTSISLNEINDGHYPRDFLLSLRLGDLGTLDEKRRIHERLVTYSHPSAHLCMSVLCLS
jgi:hypothetical protein